MFYIQCVTNEHNHFYPEGKREQIPQMECHSKRVRMIFIDFYQPPTCAELATFISLLRKKCELQYFLYCDHEFNICWDIANQKLCLRLYDVFLLMTLIILVV